MNEKTPNVALHTIEICAGVGMLGEGLRAGLAHLGIAHRTVCYLEREAYAAAVLAARMEEGSLDGAPIWPDLFTFDSAAWRGAVDCIAAGFPCQDLSLAGRRAGLDGARSGLFFDILDIAGEEDAKAAFQAAQSLLRGAPDGLAPGLDFGHRAQRLKCVGNGVVALQAAAAFVVLGRRSRVFMKHNTLRMREAV